MQCPPSFEWPTVGVGPRETREFVYELKFYIAGADEAPLLHWVRSHLAPDPHGNGPHGDTYRVSSLYFDTALHDVLARRGSYARSKYRVRRYGESEQVFLERKTRGAYRVFKRRSPIEAAALSALLTPQPMRGWSGYWFHRRLVARRLAAVNRIDYERVARIGQSSYGPMRLTLDRDLTAWPVRELSFRGGGNGVGLSPKRLILELKFGHAMPAAFKGLVREFAPRLAGISKYRLAAHALGLVAVDSSGAAADVARERPAPLASLVPAAY